MGKVNPGHALLWDENMGPRGVRITRCLSPPELHLDFWAPSESTRAAQEVVRPETPQRARAGFEIRPLSTQNASGNNCSSRNMTRMQVGSSGSQPSNHGSINCQHSCVSTLFPFSQSGYSLLTRFLWLLTQQEYHRDEEFSVVLGSWQCKIHTYTQSKQQRSLESDLQECPHKDNKASKIRHAQSVL